MAGAAEQGATLSEAEAVAMNELDLAGAAERRIAEGVFARVKAEIEAEQVPAWQRYGYSSEEAFIEHNAGASPHGLSSLPDMPTEEACLDAACVAVLMQIMREPDPKIILVLAQAYKELRLNG
jgi:hypothetical protein